MHSRYNLEEKQYNSAKPGQLVTMEHMAMAVTII